MFCPKCAAQNAEGAKYCRSCGADISLVPQALTGELAERLAEKEADCGPWGGRRRKETPNIEAAVRQIFLGVAFVLVALSVLFFVPAGSHWWFWMLIPAFVFIGGGIGMYLRVREDQRKLGAPAFSPAPASVLSAPPRASELAPPRRDTGEIAQPPSVTEATTRHLGVPAERPRRDA